MAKQTTEPTLQNRSDRFVAAVDSEVGRNGGDRQRAIRAVAKAEPQLHAAFLAWTNRDFGRLRVHQPKK